MSVGVAFLADSGGDAGWGHFVRCSALAAEFRRRDCDVSFLVNGEPPRFADPALTTMSGGQLGSASLLGLAGRPAVTVIDLFQPSPTVVEHLGGAGFVVAIIDGDTPSFPHDLAVDPNLSAHPTSCPSRLAGARFVILRSLFDDPPERVNADPAGELLVSFGGTARGPLLQTVISALKRSGDAFGQVTVFVGGGEFAHPPVGGICFKQPDSDMSLVLAGADAGIIAAGTMLHEACATGLPCAVVSLGPEQAAEAAALAARGASCISARRRISRSTRPPRPLTSWVA